MSLEDSSESGAERGTEEDVWGVDFHCHIFPPEIIEDAKRGRVAALSLEVLNRDGRLFLSSPGYFTYALTPRLYEPDALIEWMDQRRLRWAAVSLAPPLLGYWSDPATAIDHATVVNESLARICSKYPDRLFPLATVPMQAEDAIEGALRHAVSDLGMRGVEVATDVGGRRLGDPVWEPLWGTASALGIPVFVHPYHLPISSGVDGVYYLPNLVGMVSSTGMSFAHFVFSGMADKYPDATIVFAHAGGTALWLQGRWDHGYEVRPETRGGCAQPPSTYLSRFYYDLIVHSPDVARFALQLVGSDRFVLGSDYPFAMGPEDPVGELLALDLPPEERRQIASATALDLLRVNSKNLHERI